MQLVLIPNHVVQDNLLLFRDLQNQLLHENPKENTSLKRVNILKTQIFQLERQVGVQLMKPI